MPDVMNTNVHYRTTSSSVYEQPNFTVPPPGPSPIYSTGGLPHSNPPEVSMNYEPWTSRPNTGNPWGLPQRMSIPSSQQQPVHYPGVSQVRLPSENTIPQIEQQPTSRHSGIRKPATYNGSSRKDHLVEGLPNSNAREQVKWAYKNRKSPEAAHPSCQMSLVGKTIPANLNQETTGDLNCGTINMSRAIQVM